MGLWGMSQWVKKTEYPFVRKSSIDFAVVTNDDLEKFFLLDKFGMTPSNDPIVKSKDWKKTKKECIEKILMQAKEKNCNTTELKECIDVALDDKRNNKLAVVPVACFLAKQGKDDVWVVTCAWEVESWVVDEPEKHFDDGDDLLGHVRVWAIKAKDKKILFFDTCD